MSLDWSIQKVRDVEELLDNGFEEVVTEAIVWGCLGTQIGTLTEQNWREWYARFVEVERYGAWISGPDGPVHMKPEWVERRIGLKTNVFPEMSRRQWLNRMARGERDKIQDRVNDTLHAMKVESVPVWDDDDPIDLLDELLLLSMGRIEQDDWDRIAEAVKELKS